MVKMVTRKRSYSSSFELARQRAGMGERLGNKDNEYGFYSGADYLTAHKMAVLDTMLKHDLVPPQFKAMIKLYRSYLNQQRKAFFASVDADVITKLGMMLGIKDDRISF